MDYLFHKIHNFHSTTGTQYQFLKYFLNQELNEMKFKSIDSQNPDDPNNQITYLYDPDFFSIDLKKLMKQTLINIIK